MLLPHSMLGFLFSLISAPRMKRYNIFEDRQLSLEKITDESSYSTLNERSTFLRGPFCRNAKTTHLFLFLSKASLNEIGVFYITVTHQRFDNVYYGHDSTAFCLVRAERKLVIGNKYIIYGKLSKIKTFFIYALEVEPFEPKSMCYMLL